MFRITKEVYFCYGHRLMKHSGKCRHIHGHSVKASITVEAEKLDQQGMVCDFANIRDKAQDFVDSFFDHTLLLHKNDRMISYLRKSGEKFRALDEHPTAELLAKLIFEHMKSEGFNVSNVSLWETSSTYASYQEATMA